MNYLEKTKSAATQLARMTKAVADFYQKANDLHNGHMSKINALHKAHADDMSAAIGNVHKILGDESGELKSIDLEAEGTKNLQDFGANKAAGSSKGSGATATSGKGETTGENGGNGGNGGNGNGKKNDAEKVLKAEDVQQMIQKAVDSSMTSFMEEFVKALAGNDDAGNQGGNSGGNGTVEKAMSGNGNGTGVGDRSDVRPVVRAGGGGAVTKVNDATDVKPPVNSGPVDIAKAVGGDQEEALKLMRGTKSQELPVTLIEPMSKLH
jgi:hypothetical protein